MAQRRSGRSRCCPNVIFNRGYLLSTTLSYATSGVELKEVVARINQQLTALQGKGATIGPVAYSVGTNSIQAVYLGSFTYTAVVQAEPEP